MPSDHRALEAAVILPHFNDVERLARCLAALRPQAELLGGAVEVVVIDNGSDVSLDLAREAWPGVRILIETAKGAAPARNRGVAETTAPRLFFLDSDCIPEPGWLAAAIAAGPRADVVGGAVSVFDETGEPRSGAEAFETVFAFDNKGYVERKGFSVSANLLTRRDVFEDVGGFRSGLSEDLDWCRRATAAGYTLAYADDVRVLHPTRSDWSALRRKWKRITEETWGLESRGFTARAMWATRALGMIPSILAHAPKILHHPDLTGVDRGLALATLARLRLTRLGWMMAQAIRR